VLNIAAGLPGDFQKINARTVLTALAVLSKKGFAINHEKTLSALENTHGLTGIKGRWQVIREAPLTICDIGHNQGAIAAALQQINHTPHDQMHVVLGFVNDKTLDAILKLFPQNARYYFTRANLERSLDAKLLAQQAKKHGLNGHPYPSVEEAFRAAQGMAQANDLVWVTGSTFVVGEVLGLD
jgi:dihydrofolate synthase/folylpolyglutamate synthase